MCFSAKRQQAECFLTANKIELLHVTRLLFPDSKKVAMNHSDPDDVPLFQRFYRPILFF